MRWRKSQSFPPGWSWPSCCAVPFQQRQIQPWLLQPHVTISEELADLGEEQWNCFITKMTWSLSAHDRGWHSRGFPGKWLPLLHPQPHGNVLPKERAGWCGKQDTTVPQLSLYPADKAALIPHLSLNTCFVYTDIWVLTGSTHRHASTCIYMLGTYICVYLYTHTSMHCVHVCRYVLASSFLNVVGAPGALLGMYLGARCPHRYATAEQ